MGKDVMRFWTKQIYIVPSKFQGCRSRDCVVHFEPKFEDMLNLTYICRKYGHPGENSPFLKIHSIHMSANGGPEIHGSGALPTKGERSSVKLSNNIGIIENGLRTSVHDGINVPVLLQDSSKAIIDHRLITDINEIRIDRKS